MKQRLKQVFIMAALVFGFGAGAMALQAPAVSAVNVDPLSGVCTNPTPDSAVCENKDDNIGDTVTGVINALLFIVGAISVVVIIVSGLRYALSGGDAGAVTSAKNSLMYAIIGLVVAFLAYAIVNWVLKLFV